MPKVYSNSYLMSRDTRLVLLRDAPRGSFLAAKNAEKMEKHPYMDTETVSWSVMDLEEGITFAFVPPPFHYIRPMIEPLLGVSGLNEWVLGILGLSGSILLTPIVKPVLLSIAQKRFGSWIDQHFEAKVRADTNSKFPRMDLSKPDVIFVIKIPDSSVMVEGAIDQVEKGTLKVVWVKLPELRSIAGDLIHQNAKDYFSQMRFQFNPKSEKWEFACLTLRKSGRTIQGSKYCRPDHPLKVR